MPQSEGHGREAGQGRTLSPIRKRASRTTAATPAKKQLKASTVGGRSIRSTTPPSAVQVPPARPAPPRSARCPPEKGPSAEPGPQPPPAEEPGPPRPR